MSASWLAHVSLNFNVFLTGSYKISPKPCEVPDEQNSHKFYHGTCMFVWECIKSNGKHLGMCVDGFMFGSCCKHNASENSLYSSEEFSSTNVILHSSTGNSVINEPISEISEEFAPDTDTIFITTTPNFPGQVENSNGSEEETYELLKPITAQLMGTENFGSINNFESSTNNFEDLTEITSPSTEQDCVGNCLLKPNTAQMMGTQHSSGSTEVSNPSVDSSTEEDCVGDCLFKPLNTVQFMGEENFASSTQNLPTSTNNDGSTEGCGDNCMESKLPFVTKNSSMPLAGLFGAQEEVQESTEFFSSNSPTTEKLTTTRPPTTEKPTTTERTTTTTTSTRRPTFSPQMTFINPMTSTTERVPVPIKNYKGCGLAQMAPQKRIVGGLEGNYMFYK